MILITTAGKVGSEAARQLAQRGEPVRVLVRSPDKAAALATNGIDVFQGDLEIPASLDAAMRGVTRDQAQIEHALIASGLGYTLLRNNAYMQNFIMMAPAIADTSSFSTATGNGRVGHIDARDVAAVAAEIAASPSAHAERPIGPPAPRCSPGPRWQQFSPRSSAERSPSSRSPSKSKDRP
jgi:uncharacterized protein YbjT (DUF2867 family)